MEMQNAIQELNRRKEKAKELGGEEKVKRQHILGRLTARERIERLIEPNSFFEIGMLRTDSRIIEPCRNRMGFHNLSILILK